MGVGSEIFVAAGDFIQVPTILAYMHWESLSGESSIVGKYCDSNSCVGQRSFEPVGWGGQNHQNQGVFWRGSGIRRLRAGGVVAVAVAVGR